jgi:hypothetical protein
MVAVMMNLKETALQPGARILAEFAGNDSMHVSIVELGGSLRLVSRRMARQGSGRAIQVGTIQQGFDLARKVIEGRRQPTSCARSR